MKGGGEKRGTGQSCSEGGIVFPLQPHPNTNNEGRKERRGTQIPNTAREHVQWSHHGQTILQDRSQRQTNKESANKGNYKKF